MNPIFLVAAGIMFFGLGLGLGYWMALLQRKDDAVRVSDLQEEMDEYRRRVSEHFGETAQHFQELGKQYQSLYTHMAKGAGSLCDVAQSDALLGFAGGDAEAIPASAKERPEEVPEVIRDYATAEESEPSKLEPGPEESKSDIEAEPSAKEPVSDKVDTQSAIEEERTVH